MSSGVSDQMKVPGSTGKNLEQRNIPWSQQVDEASYENLASPANDDNSVANNSSMQFQYPPFNAKESLNNPWNNFNKPRKSSNFENNKNFGKSENYNNGKRDDFQPSAWGRRPPPPSSDNSGSYNNRSGQQQQQQNNRYDDGYGGAGGKLDANNKSSAANNMAIEQNRKTNTMASVAAPKKTTYAWIISQPVPTSRTTLITSSHKKKGPGMPPPPMVPGKHNLDVNIWDLPNNNPPPVPSPPPPLDLSQIDGNSSDSMAGGPVSNMFRHDLAGRPDKITNHKTTTNTNNNNNHNNDYMRDNDNKSNYSNSNNNNNNNNHSNNSNYGRGRSPTNGHGRKAWQNAPQTLMPAAQQQPMPGGRSIVGSGGANTASGPNIMRRSINDNTNISSGGGGGRNYTGYRKPEPRPFNAGGQSSRGGSESESAPYNNYRDENNPRNYDQNVQQQQQHHHHQPPPQQQQQQAQQQQQQPGGPTVTEVDKVSAESVLEELRMKNTYNPLKLDLEMAKMARFFVIKSYSEDDIHRSIKYELWCSTDHGNQRLDEAFKERQEKGGHVLLFFSVNSSRHFCGMAQMKTAVDYNCKLDVWSQDKWKGIFQVKWIYVKDVPNGHLRHIRLENNENKSVTHSRDVQEVPNARGIEVLQIMHSFKNMTSIFDDFHHYEKKQEEEGSARTLSHYENINQAAAAAAAAASTTSSHNQRHYGRQPLHSNDDRDGRDSRDSRGGMGQKYFSNGPNGGGFRDRNNSMIHRGNNGGGGGFYGEQRRYDNHRNHMADGGDKEQPRDEFANNNNNNRYAQKFDSNRRLDERNPFKQQQQQPQQHNNNNNNNRDKDRDFSEDKQNSNNEARF